MQRRKIPVNKKVMNTVPNGPAVTETPVETQPKTEAALKTEAAPVEAPVEAQSKTAPTPKTEAQVEAAPKTEAPVETAPKTEATVEAPASTAAAPKPQPPPKPKAKVKAKAKPETEAKTEPKAKPETEAKADTKAKPETTEKSSRSRKKNYYAYYANDEKLSNSKFIGIHPGQAANKVVSAIVKQQKKENKPIEDLYNTEIKFYLSEIPTRELTKEQKEKCANKKFHYIGSVQPVNPDPEFYKSKTGKKTNIELEIENGKVVAVKIPHVIKKGTAEESVSYIIHRYVNKVKRDPDF